MEIFTLNCRDNVLYDVVRNIFDLSEAKTNEFIHHEYQTMRERLKKKGIEYETLKRALVPCQEKKKTEVCLVFDSVATGSDFYGLFIFDLLIPLLDKKSTYSILIGDYCNVLEGERNSEKVLKKMMFDPDDNNFIGINSSEYYNSNQYFLVYINSITEFQLNTIVEGMKEYGFFTGYVRIKTASRFKAYLASILTPLCIKAKETVILMNSDEIDDEDNINERGYPFEKSGFRVISINEMSFLPFLSYKIESVFADEDDNSFAFNALYPQACSLKGMKLILKDRRWEYLQKEKGGIIESFGELSQDKKSFCDLILLKVRKNYIYRLRQDEHDGALMFDVCVDIPTNNKGIRKSTVGLKYYPKDKTMEIVTIT